MLSIVIPISNGHPLTNDCVDQLQSATTQPIDIIIVDNNSEQPFKRSGVTTIYNSWNNGFWDAMVQGIEAAKYPIVMCMHNDVFIYDDQYVEKIVQAFQTDDNLALAGLFGSRGVGVNGARLYPESNMLGLKYGTPWHQHGSHLTTQHPSVVFDSLCMIFDRKKLLTIDTNSIPKYHWTDRVVTLRLLAAGYHALTIGIAHDHGNSQTALAQATPGVSRLEQLAEILCRNQGIEKLESWDLAYYRYGEALFRDEFLAFTNGQHRLWVDECYNLIKGM